MGARPLKRTVCMVINVEVPASRGAAGGGGYGGCGCVCEWETGWGSTGGDVPAWRVSCSPVRLPSRTRAPRPRHPQVCPSANPRVVSPRLLYQCAWLQLRYNSASS